jgi:hypothetical protein
MWQYNQNMWQYMYNQQLPLSASVAVTKPTSNPIWALELTRYVNLGIVTGLNSSWLTILIVTVAVSYSCPPGKSKTIKYWMPKVVFHRLLLQQYHNTCRKKNGDSLFYVTGICFAKLVKSTTARSQMSCWNAICDDERTEKANKYALTYYPTKLSESSIFQ